MRAEVIPTFRIPNCPPIQALLTRSAGLEGAQSPEPRGIFLYGLLTDLMATHPRKSVSNPASSQNLLTCSPWYGGRGGERQGFGRRTDEQLRLFRAKRATLVSPFERPQIEREHSDPVEWLFAPACIPVRREANEHLSVGS